MAVSNFKAKATKALGTNLVDYSRAPCLGADQKAHGLWERDCKFVSYINPEVEGRSMKRKNILHRMMLLILNSTE